MCSCNCCGSGSCSGCPSAFGWLTKRPHPGLAEAFLRPARTDAEIRRDAVKALVGLDPQSTVDAVPGLRAFHRPVLLAWAPDDRVFPIAGAERLAVDFPDARLERVPDSYAFVPEDQPDRLAGLIAGFVREKVRV